MAERTTIARPYADAAFETARDGNLLGTWSEMLKLAENIASNPAMAEALASPKLDAPAKTTLFLSIAADRFAPAMRNFVRILVESERVSVLPEIRELFEVRKNAAEGVAKARIETAMPLSEAQLHEITTALGARFGAKIEATVEVDPSLIGGARIAVGDTVIDGSVRGKLSTMAQALTA